nr:tail protein [Staphylococcus phage S-CoN_Ph37]
MASKFVRSVKDVYNIEKFNDNLVDVNDIVSTIDGDVYLYTKNGFIQLQGIEELQDEMQELEEKLSDNEKRIYDNEEKIKVIETSVEDSKLKVNEVTEKLNSYNFEELKQKIDAINIDELKQEQETLNKKIDETTKATNKKIDDNTSKIKDNTTKINNIKITDTGWKDLTLSEGYTNYSDTPQYRITSVNGIQMIDLRGSVKGIKENKSQTISKLPLSEDLTNPHYFVQNASKKSGSITFVRWTVQRNGNCFRGVNGINVRRFGMVPNEYILEKLKCGIIDT